MTRQEYLNRFEEKCKSELELTRRKNSDYAGADNAFKNFELIEYLTSGRITAAEGLLVRMSDKLIRFANLLSRPAQVKDEKITDTLDDLSVYAKITSIVLGAQEKQEPASVPAEQVAPLTPEEAKHILMTELNQKGSLTPAKRTLLQMLNLERAA